MGRWSTASLPHALLSPPPPPPGYTPAVWTQPQKPEPVRRGFVIALCVVVALVFGLIGVGAIVSAVQGPTGEGRPTSAAERNRPATAILDRYVIEGGGTPFVAPDKSFGATFPAEPDSATTENTTIVEVEVELTTFVISSTDLGVDSTVDLNAAAESFARSFNGQLVTNNPVSWNGFSAVEVTLARNADLQIARALIVSTPGRLYQIEVRGLSAMSPAFDVFVESFSIDPESRPAFD